MASASFSTAGYLSSKKRKFDTFQANFPGQQVQITFDSRQVTQTGENDRVFLMDLPDVVSRNKTRYSQCKIMNVGFYNNFKNLTLQERTLRFHLTDVAGTSGVNQDFSYILDEGFYTFGSSAAYGTKDLLAAVRDAIVAAFVSKAVAVTSANVTVALQTDIAGNQTGSCKISLTQTAANFDLTIYAEKNGLWDLLGFSTQTGVVTPYVSAIVGPDTYPSISSTDLASFLRESYVFLCSRALTGDNMAFDTTGSLGQIITSLPMGTTNFGEWQETVIEKPFSVNLSTDKLDFYLCHRDGTKIQDARFDVILTLSSEEFTRD